MHAPVNGIEERLDIIIQQNEAILAALKVMGDLLVKPVLRVDGPAITASAGTDPNEIAGIILDELYKHLPPGDSKAKRKR